MTLSKHLTVNDSQLSSVAMKDRLTSTLKEKTNHSIWGISYKNNIKH